MSGWSGRLGKNVRGRNAIRKKALLLFSLLRPGKILVTWRLSQLATLTRGDYLLFSFSDV